MRDNLINIYGEIKINYHCTRIFIPLNNRARLSMYYEANEFIHCWAGAKPKYDIELIGWSSFKVYVCNDLLQSKASRQTSLSYFLRAPARSLLQIYGELTVTMCAIFQLRAAAVRLCVYEHSKFSSLGDFQKTLLIVKCITGSIRVRGIFWYIY